MAAAAAVVGIAVSLLSTVPVAVCFGCCIGVLHVAFIVIIVRQRCAAIFVCVLLLSMCHLCCCNVALCYTRRVSTRVV